VKRLIALASAAGLSAALVAITGPAGAKGWSLYVVHLDGTRLRPIPLQTGAAPAEDVREAARSTRRSFT
jgi:hypothetical protein